MLLNNCKYNHNFLKIGVISLLFFNFSISFTQIKSPNLPISSIGIEIENYKQSFNSKATNSNQICLDSNYKSRIVKLWKSSNENYTVEIELAEYNSEIQLVVFNMLGKEALEIYKGVPNKFDTRYEFSSSSLPNGVYLCILLGSNFKRAEKFIVSR